MYGIAPMVHVKLMHNSLQQLLVNDTHQGSPIPRLAEKNQCRNTEAEKSPVNSFLHTNLFSQETNLTANQMICPTRIRKAVEMNHFAIEQQPNHIQSQL